MGKKIAVDLVVLKTLYIDESRPMHEVAEIMGLSVGKIYKTLTENNFPKRAAHKGMLGKKHTKNAKAKISKGNKNKIISVETRLKMAAASTKGGIGYKKKRTDGYIAVYFPDHPCSSKDGYIMEHILVAEALLGRHLNSNECVHHKNKKRNDNRKENLQVMTKSEHLALHRKERKQTR
mgnify:CR=1 FL=1